MRVSLDRGGISDMSEAIHDGEEHSIGQGCVKAFHVVDQTFELDGSKGAARGEFVGHETALVRPEADHTGEKSLSGIEGAGFDIIAVGARYEESDNVGLCGKGQIKQAMEKMVVEGGGRYCRGMKAAQTRLEQSSGLDVSIGGANTEAGKGQVDKGAPQSVDQKLDMVSAFRILSVSMSLQQPGEQAP